MQTHFTDIRSTKNLRKYFVLVSHFIEEDSEFQLLPNPTHSDLISTGSQVSLLSDPDSEFHSPLSLIERQDDWGYHPWKQALPKSSMSKNMMSLYSGP